MRMVYPSFSVSQFAGPTSGRAHRRGGPPSRERWLGWASVVAALVLAVPSGAASAATETGWAELSAGAPRAEALPSGSATERQTAAQACVALADQMKNFAQQRAADTPAAVAAHTEARLLLRAAECGDISRQARLAELVAAVRSDIRVPETARFIVASRFNEAAILTGPKLNHGQLLAAYERSARQMMAEFPEQPEPYLALAALAEDQPDSAAAAKLAAEVQGLPAPVEAKGRAADLASRLALEGQTPGLSVTTEKGRVLALGQAREKPLVVYTWSAADQNSLNLAKRLESALGDSVVLLGINLDADIRQAKTSRTATGLKSDQVFAFGVTAGPEGAPLRLNRPGLVYLFDGQGILRDVRGIQGLREKLTAMQKGGQS